MKRFGLIVLFVIIATAPIIAQESHVTMKVSDTQKRKFSVEFTPQSDVKKYLVLSMEDGMMDYYKTIYAAQKVDEVMILQEWGGEEKGVQTVTWKDDIAPGTDYKVYVMGIKNDEEYFGIDSLSLKTVVQGGTGEARVTVTQGEYKNQDWYGELLPSQFLTFTPNEETACYRYGVYLKSQYDTYDPDIIKADIQQDPPMPDISKDYWFKYETLTTDFQIDPETQFVVCASAKNADGVWGSFDVFDFTTAKEITGIETVESEELRTENNDVFNLAGQRLSNARNGNIYIRNGRKTVNP